MSDPIQGSSEWLEQRRGWVTASRLVDVMAKGKGVSRANYMAELVVQRLTGVFPETYTSPEMQWGTDNEAGAAAAYAFLTDHDVAEVGFVPHPRIGKTGASPDRRVNSDGLLEIKCPKTNTHIQTLLGGKIDRRYILQMQWQMECDQRQWCDFVSFDPRMPPEMQLHIQRVERDEAMIADITTEVMQFLIDLDRLIDKLREQYA